MSASSLCLSEEQLSQVKDAPNEQHSSCCQAVCMDRWSGRQECTAQCSCVSSCIQNQVCCKSMQVDAGHY